MISYARQFCCPTVLSASPVVLSAGGDSGFALKTVLLCCPRTGAATGDFRGGGVNADRRANGRQREAGIAPDRLFQVEHAIGRALEHVLPVENLGTPDIGGLQH